MRRVFSSICPKYYSYYHSHTRVTFFIIATCFLVVQLVGRLGSGNPFCLDKLEVMNYFFFLSFCLSIILFFGARRIYHHYHHVFQVIIHAMQIISSYPFSYIRLETGQCIIQIYSTTPLAPHCNYQVGIILCLARIYGMGHRQILFTGLNTRA